MNHRPSPVCDDLPYSKALVLEGSRKLVLIPVYDHDNHGRRYPGAALLYGLGLRFANGWGVVRRLAGRRWGGMIVYLLTGCPICATADPPLRIASAAIVHQCVPLFTGQSGRAHERHARSKCNWEGTFSSPAAIHSKPSQPPIRRWRGELLADKVLAIQTTQ